MKKFFILTTIVFLYSTCFAESISKPYTFTSGTPANAGEVNANFDTVYSQVNKIGSAITVDETGRVGIGTESPSNALSLVASDPVGPQRITITTYRSGGYPFGGGAFTGRLAHGTIDTPSPVQANENLAAFTGQGYGGPAGFTTPSNGAIFIKSEENWTDSNKGTLMSFVTTPPGSITPIEQLRITGAGNVGIGTTAPSTKLEIASDYAVSGLADVSIVSYHDGVMHPANLTGRKARGTKDAPTAVLAGDFLSLVGARGYNDTQGFNHSTNASIGFRATEDFTETSMGTDIRFRTTANGTISTVERMRIDQNGNVGIGTTTPASALQVAGYIQLDLSVGAPPVGDCDDPSEYGRMKVDNDNDLLWICMTSGWHSK